MMLQCFKGSKMPFYGKVGLFVGFNGGVFWDKLEAAFVLMLVLTSKK